MVQVLIKKIIYRESEGVFAIVNYKYFDIEKKSDEELQGATTNLDLEQKKIESASNDLFSSLNTAENTSVLRDSLSEIEQSKKLINSGDITEASKLIDLSIDKLKSLISKFENFSEKNGIEEIDLVINKSVDGLEYLLDNGIEKTMNKFN